MYSAPGSALTHSGPSSGPTATPPFLGAYKDSGNPFERVLPREMLNHLVTLYFEYMFWINPYPHRPTFERDLANRREEEPGQDEWAAMVFGMLGFVCLLPKQLLPLSPDESSALMGKCLEQLMAFIVRSDYTTVTHQRRESPHSVADTSVRDPLRGVSPARTS
jgi:hypothetical protein